MTQDIRPPVYFIPRVWSDDMSEALREFNVSIGYEIDRYFSNTQQNPPVFLEGKSHEECAGEIISHVLKQRGVECT